MLACIIVISLSLFHAPPHQNLKNSKHTGGGSTLEHMMN